MIDPTARFRKKGEFVIRPLEDEYLLVPVNQDTVDLDRAFAVNETGAFIFERLDGSHMVSEIVDLLCESFEVSRKEATDDTEAFINRIKERFLV